MKCYYFTSELETKEQVTYTITTLEIVQITLFRIPKVIGRPTLYNGPKYFNQLPNHINTVGILKPFPPNVIHSFYNNKNYFLNSVIL